MTAADYEHLEARVAELEHQMRNVLVYKIDAVAFGLSVMHHEVTETLGEHGERLSRMELQLAEHGERFDRIDARLDAHDQRFDRIDARLDGIDARLDGHDERFDRIDAQLTDHGHLLAEILRRIPGDGDSASDR